MGQSKCAWSGECSRTSKLDQFLPGLQRDMGSDVVLIDDNFQMVIFHYLLLLIDSVWNGTYINSTSPFLEGVCNTPCASNPIKYTALPLYADQLLE